MQSVIYLFMEILICDDPLIAVIVFYVSNILDNKLKSSSSLQKFRRILCPFFKEQRSGSVVLGWKLIQYAL